MSIISKYKIKGLSAALFLLSVSAGAKAQVPSDTGKKKPVVDITSSYKPVLRNAVKINFSASQPEADTNRQVGKYTIPSQNLFFSYQPVSLKPLALQHDTALDLGQRNFVKVGFGNLSTPYVSAGFSFGDGKKSLLNLYADYIASKGTIKNQDYAQLRIRGSGSFFTAKNEFYAGAQLVSNDYYLYGYNHLLHNYKKDSVRLRYQDITLQAGLRNLSTGDIRFKYNPNVQVNIFNSDKRASESNLVVTAPIETKFGDAFALKIEGKADITSYTTKNLASNIKLSNNVFSIAPSLVITTPRFTINGGIIPTWDNGKLVLLPNIYAEGQLQEKVFMVQAGWVGTYTKNTFRHLASINPWIQTIRTQFNTKEVELYGGIKAMVGKHFNFSAKAGVVTFDNASLFVNDSLDGNSFYVRNESRMGALRIHGDISYINQDKFTLTSGITFNGYTGLRDNARAWGTVPMELNASLRWWAFKQVMLKSDFYMFTGGAYLQKNVSGTGTGGTDLSVGAEFKVNKTFSAWVDFNNVFSSKYQRWHNYEVYGLNIMGGVRVNF
jgi:hypothetical protein